MKRMQTLMCIVLALSLLLGLGLAGAQAESAGKIVVFQQKTEIYDQLVELAKVLKTHHTLGLKGGILVANPIPQAYSMDADAINAVIDQAVAEADEKGIHGKQTTPFLLAKVKEITGGDSLEANIQLVFNNAKLAAQTAVAYSALS